jgi:hypothetical protein
MSNLVKTLTQKQSRHMLSGVRHEYGIGPQNHPYQSDGGSQAELWSRSSPFVAQIMPSSRIVKLPFARTAMNLIPSFHWLDRALAFALVIVPLVVTSCSSCSRRQTCAPPPKDDAQYALPPPSTAAPTVDVFLDSTLSMQGFVSAGTNSNFQQTVPILESAVISGWAGGETHFFKFGNQIEALTNRSYLDAVKPEFYLDSDYNLLTLIENVIDSAKLDHLTVIVTDLFQNNSDVNQLSDKIKRKYIAAGLGVGVFGIKSEFKGEVYDVGPKNYSFPYVSGGDPKKFRPFYLLVLGSHSDVAKYFEALTYAGLNKFPAELQQRVIFSPFIASPLANFEGPPNFKANKIARQDPGTLVRTAAKDARITEFKIVGLPDSANFSTELTYHPLSDVVLTSNDLAAEITAWVCSDKANANPQSMTESAEAKSAFKLKTANVTSDNQRIQLEAQIDPKTLPGAGIYQFRVVLRPRDYSLPQWITDWNMKTELIDYWHGKPTEFDGGKTYNLENFLKTLWGAVLDAHHPKSGILYIYIKRESN